MTSTGSRALLASLFLMACVGTTEPMGPSQPDPTGSGGSGGSGSDDVGDDTSPAGGDNETINGCEPGEDTIYQPAPEVSGANGSYTSGIRGGSGGTPMIVSCGVTSCADGQVGVEEPANPVLGEEGGIQCVEAPPTCPGGTSPFWVRSVMDPEDPFNEVGGFWVCSVPCDVVVDFGGLYGFQSACAGEPPSCPGATPTFMFETHEWQCAPMCDGGLYDPVEFEGTTVCVPC
jgi:hypothetical protein